MPPSNASSTQQNLQPSATTVKQLPLNPTPRSSRRSRNVGITEMGSLRVHGSDLYLLRGEKVRRGRLPRWVRKLQNQQEASWQLLFHEGWLDHIGVLRDDGQEYFVSEPYDLDSDAIRDLVKDAERFNFDFQISALSYHYPTRTVRILAWPREAKR